MVGPHFRDWQWAQNALGVEIGRRGFNGPDWFEVNEDQLDRSDPDCVWRQRLVKNRERLELWSPVRWVAQLVKLPVPLRTFQVRMLDSGEAYGLARQGRALEPARKFGEDARGLPKTA
jgi:hypothetical protein